MTKAKKSFYKIFICSLILLTASFSLYKTSLLHADAREEKKEMTEEELIKNDEDMREKERASIKFICEKMNTRTKECKESLDSLFFSVDSLRAKLHQEKETEREKEFIAILSDYNSVQGDLGVMQGILSMADLIIEDEKFVEYFDLMAVSFEHLKNSFSLKNELFLGRINSLENENALQYEKKLLKLYREYFEYDLWREQIDEVEPEKGE